MPNEFLRLFDAVLESSSPDNFLRKVRWVHLNHDRISRRFSTIKITLTIRTCPDPHTNCCWRRTVLQNPKFQLLRSQIQSPDLWKKQNPRSTALRYSIHSRGRTFVASFEKRSIRILQAMWRGSTDRLQKYQRWVAKVGMLVLWKMVLDRQITASRQSMKWNYNQ